MTDTQRQYSLHRLAAQVPDADGFAFCVACERFDVAEDAGDKCRYRDEGGEYEVWLHPYCSSCGVDEIDAAMDRIPYPRAMPPEHSYLERTEFGAPEVEPAGESDHDHWRRILPHPASV